MQDINKCHSVKCCFNICRIVILLHYKCLEEVNTSVEIERNLVLHALVSLAFMHVLAFNNFSINNYTTISVLLERLRCIVFDNQKYTTDVKRIKRQKPYINEGLCN